MFPDVACHQHEVHDNRVDEDGQEEDANLPDKLLLFLRNLFFDFLPLLCARFWHIWLLIRALVLTSGILILLGRLESFEIILNLFHWRWTTFFRFILDQVLVWVFIRQSRRFLLIFVILVVKSLFDLRIPRIFTIRVGLVSNIILVTFCSCVALLNKLRHAFNGQIKLCWDNRSALFFFPFWRHFF